jgi:hypothetical protein
MAGWQDVEAYTMGWISLLNHANNITSTSFKNMRPAFDRLQIKDRVIWVQIQLMLFAGQSGCLVALLCLLSFENIESKIDINLLGMGFDLQLEHR